MEGKLVLLLILALILIFYLPSPRSKIPAHLKQPHIQTTLSWVQAYAKSSKNELIKTDQIVGGLTGLLMGQFAGLNFAPTRNSESHLSDLSFITLRSFYFSATTGKNFRRVYAAILLEYMMENLSGKTLEKPKAPSNSNPKDPWLTALTTQPSFLEDPFLAALTVWNQPTKFYHPSFLRKPAFSLALFRALPLVWMYQFNKDKLLHHTILVTEFLDPDPRCVAATLALNFTLVDLLNKTDPLKTILQRAYSQAKKVLHEKIREMRERTKFDVNAREFRHLDNTLWAHMHPTSLDTLRLKEGALNHIWKGTGLAFLTISEIFKRKDTQATPPQIIKGWLTEIKEAGGAVVDNCALAGCILGLVLGYSAFPQPYPNFPDYPLAREGIILGASFYQDEVKEIEGRLGEIEKYADDLSSIGSIEL